MAEKLLREYLIKNVGLDSDYVEELDLSDFGQFLEDKHYSIFDKIHRQEVD